MKKSVTEGLITTKHNNIVFRVCKITYIVFDNDKFRYEFEPYYDVIDILGEQFQGIPGLNLDLRKEVYIRENKTPCFISERVPHHSRENYYEMLEEAGLEVMDPIKYLINTSYQYFGDDLKVIPYEPRRLVKIEDELTTQNVIGTMKVVLDNVAKGNSVIFGDLLVNSRNSKEIFNSYLFLYNRSSATLRQQRKDEIKDENRSFRYAGRKPKEIDEALFREYLNKVRLGLISNVAAAKEMNIPIATYNRAKKRIQNELN